MKNCLDTGTIQAFLDGELAPAAASSVSSHIAACDACASQLAAAEEESAFVFSVLEREIDTLVPTQRLWSKINETIEVERHNAPFWKKAWAYVSVVFANPSIAVAAALVVVFGLFTAVMVNRQEPTVATINNPPVVTPDNGSGITPISNDPSAVVPSKGEQTAPSRAEFVSSRPQHRSDIEGSRGPRQPVVTQAVYIPGEESYVKTINTLSSSVDNKKDTVLRPSERISYERDMAVVDDAIAKMKKEVRKNPKNESAKQVLYTSYQNKIDLLNSVSQREELVASLKD